MDGREELTVGETPPVTAWPARVLGLGALAALRYRDFRILWLGLLLSSSTIMFQFFAIGWLIQTHFPRVLGPGFPVLLMLGIAGLTRGAGMFLFSIIGGALADRLERRNLAVATQVTALTLGGLFAALIAFDLIQIWQVFLLLFVTSATQTLDLPARQAIIPEVVAREHITNAVVLSLAAMQTSFAYSPLLAGYFLDTLGIGGTYAASMAGHVAILLSLLFIRYRGTGGAMAGTSVLSNVSEGVRYARGDAAILGILATTFGLSAFGMSIITNLSPYWMEEVLEVNPTTWGQLAAVWGGGYVVAGYGLSVLGNFRYKGKVFLLSALVFAGLLIAWGLVRSLVWFSVVQFVMAGAFNATMLAGNAIIQNTVPNEVRGRVVSLIGLNPAIFMINGISVGAIAQGAGATTAVPLIGVALAGAAALALVALPRLRGVD